MAGIWDATLTAAEFEAAALHLVEVWKSQCPQLPAWTWHVYEPSLKSPALAFSVFTLSLYTTCMLLFLYVFLNECTHVVVALFVLQKLQIGSVVN
jgi:hypothetical protein